MLWIVPVIIAALMLIRLTVRLDAGRETAAWLQLVIRLGPFRLTRQLRIVRTDSGHQLVRKARNGTLHPVQAAAFRSRWSAAVMKALQQCTPARQILLRTSKMHELRGHICLAGADAARTALLVQTFRTVCHLLPKTWREVMRVQVLPSFFNDHSSFRLRCIVSWPLGILVITSWMLAVKLCMQHGFRAKEAA